MSHPLYIDVRDHRDGQETRRRQYLTANVIMALAFGDEYSQPGCTGQVNVMWTLTPVQLTPPSRYHTALDVAGETQAVSMTRTHDEAIEGCVIENQFIGLALGIWEARVQTQVWGTLGQIELHSRSGIYRVNFMNFVNGLTLGLNFPEQMPVEPSDVTPDIGHRKRPDRAKGRSLSQPSDGDLPPGRENSNHLGSVPPPPHGGPN